MEAYGFQCMACTPLACRRAAFCDEGAKPLIQTAAWRAGEVTRVSAVESRAGMPHLLKAERVGASFVYGQL
eukprot:3119953-Amphidinium_carterae.1